MEIETDIAMISTKIDNLDEVSDKADHVLEMVNETQRELAEFNKIQNWLITTLVTGIGIPILIVIISAWLA